MLDDGGIPLEKLMRIEDLPEEFQADTFRILNSFTTPLLRIRTGEQADDQPLLIGSGTLVRIGKKCGILTAHHVVQPLKGPFRLGLPITEEENKYSVPEDRFSIIDIARGTTDSEGPDLAFIGLGVPDVTTIRAVKSFYDLDHDKEKMLAAAPALDAGVWAACGTLGIRTRIEPSEIGSSAALAVNSYCAFSTPNRESETGEFDYIELEVNYRVGPHVPETFGGTSGGGLWQVLIHENEKGEIERAGFYLSGVIFYETDVVDHHRSIRCHGRRSVYEISYNYIVRT